MAKTDQNLLNEFSALGFSINENASFDVSRSVNVTFTNRGFAKAFEKKPEINKENIAPLLGILKDIKLEVKEPREFKSVREFVGIDYVGYRIEKERLDKQNGTWIRTDEYKIIGSDARQFIDTRVAYGNVYRYRIKSVVKLTYKKPRNSLSILQELKSSSTILPQKASTIDELINGLTLGKLTTNKLQELKNREVIKDITSVKNKQDEYVSVYYESNPSKNWMYVPIFDPDLPKPPTAIHIIPNSVKKEIMISWLKPADAKDTLKSYNIYRRSKVGERWLLLAGGRGLFSPLNETTNLFVDKGVEFNRKYIYAISVTDVHGIESFLSVQIQAELNSNYAKEREEKKLKWISGSGLSVTDTNVQLKKFVEKTEQIIAKKNLYLAPSTKMNETSKDLIIRIRSLDVNETKEFKITLKNTNMTKKDGENL